jgi:selenocysteine-specific elongation factor
VTVGEALVQAASFTPVRTGDERTAAGAIAAVYLRGRFTPPGRAEVLAALPDRGAGDRMFQALLDDGTLVDADGVVFHRDAIAEIEARVIGHLREHGDLTVAAVRDLVGSSRKYVLAALELLDARHVTRRIGDKRVLGRVVGR